MFNEPGLQSRREGMSRHYNEYQEISMGASAKSVANTTTDKKWGTMNGTEKMIFVGKVCLMICTLGFICGNALVEGVTYELL